MRSKFVISLFLILLLVVSGCNVEKSDKVSLKDQCETSLRKGATDGKACISYWKETIPNFEEVADAVKDYITSNKFEPEEEYIGELKKIIIDLSGDDNAPNFLIPCNCCWSQVWKPCSICPGSPPQCGCGPGTCDISPGNCGWYETDHTCCFVCIGAMLATVVTYKESGV